MSRWRRANWQSAAQTAWPRWHARWRGACTPAPLSRRRCTACGAASAAPRVRDRHARGARPERAGCGEPFRRSSAPLRRSSSPSVALARLRLGPAGGFTWVVKTFSKQQGRVTSPWVQASAACCAGAPWPPARVHPPLLVFGPCWAATHRLGCLGPLTISPPPATHPPLLAAAAGGRRGVAAEGVAQGRRRRRRHPPVRLPRVQLCAGALRIPMIAQIPSWRGVHGVPAAPALAGPARRRAAGRGAPTRAPAAVLARAHAGGGGGPAHRGGLLRVLLPGPVGREGGGEGPAAAVLLPRARPTCGSGCAARRHCPRRCQGAAKPQPPTPTATTRPQEGLHYCVDCGKDVFTATTQARGVLEMVQGPASDANQAALAAARWRRPAPAPGRPAATPPLPAWLARPPPHRTGARRGWCPMMSWRVRTADTCGTTCWE